MRAVHSALVAGSWLAACASAAAFPAQNGDIRSLLKSSLTLSSGTALSFPGDVAFDNATERWDIYDPPTYFAAVSPSTVDDVVRTVSSTASVYFSYGSRLIYCLGETCRSHSPTISGHRWPPRIWWYPWAAEKRPGSRSEPLELGSCGQERRIPNHRPRCPLQRHIRQGLRSRISHP